MNNGFGSKSNCLEKTSREIFFKRTKQSNITQMTDQSPLEVTPFIPAQSIDYADGSVVSKVITRKTGGNITLFAFDKDEELAEHSSPHDALGPASRRRSRNYNRRKTISC
jgi:hypothetical protein